MRFEMTSSPYGTPYEFSATFHTRDNLHIICAAYFTRIHMMLQSLKQCRTTCARRECSSYCLLFMATWTLKRYGNGERILLSQWLCARRDVEVIL